MDDDGYMVTVDGGSARSVAINGTVMVTPLPVGERSVQLNEVASNCAVAGDNPRSVTVTANGTSETTFDVACGPPLPPAAGKIAFMSRRNGRVQIWPDQVFTMNGTGAEVTQITEESPELDVSEPLIWLSPDGSRILFEACNEVLFCDLWIVNDDGTGLSRLTADGTGGGFADWSPDGTKIAFRNGEGIDVINADGTGRVELSPFGGGPDWSPDGTRIVFAGEHPDSEFSGLWVMNSDGTGLTQLTDFGGWWPRWSPDGAKITFEGPPEQVWIVNPDGTGLTRLADGYRMAWSPDGSKIAFVKNTRLGSEGVVDMSTLYIMSADGSDATAVVTDLIVSPDWSPDGSQIVYQSVEPLPSLRGAIVTVYADGAGSTTVVPHDFPNFNGHPSWAP
jgi:TolB protein